MSANDFKSLAPTYKEVYSKGKKMKKRWSKIGEYLSGKKGKKTVRGATGQEEPRDKDDTELQRKLKEAKKKKDEEKRRAMIKD